MLKKLLKYELKATSRGIMPLYLALLVLAVMLRIFVVNNINVESDAILNLIKVLSVFLYGATMAAIAVATLLIIVQRFHKNLLGDEGYLMHTIPVSIHQNITSKLIASIIWCCFSIIIAIISILIIASTKSLFTDFLPELFKILAKAFSELGFNALIIIIEIIIAGVLQLASNISHLYISISIGHLLPKMKILGSFLSYLGITAAMSIVMTVAAQVCFSIPSLPVLLENLANNSPITFTNIILIICILINALWFVIFYVSTHYLLKNKLNLE